MECVKDFGQINYGYSGETDWSRQPYWEHQNHWFDHDLKELRDKVIITRYGQVNGIYLNSIKDEKGSLWMNTDFPVI